MRKRIIKLISILTFILILTLFRTAFGADNSVTYISINSGKTLKLAVDDFVTLDVEIKPSNANADGIIFSSSEPAIADVDYQGNVTAKKVGKTTITAELDGKKSSIAVTISKKNDSLGVDFSVKEVSGTDFKEITVTPHRYDDGEILEDSAEDEYYIYLPSGYFAEGKNASYVADRDGVYPFTIYYGNNKRTFYYTVKDIDSADLENDEDDDDDSDEMYFDYKLMYDYEKKQVLFNMKLDKVRTVITPDKKVTVSNEINYYLNTLKNNAPYDFSITVDGKKYDYKIIKQGEFYLLISLSSVNYDNYSKLVEYSGYNFTSNETFEAIPTKDIFYDNGNYEVLIQSNSNSKEIFNFNITGIDFRRPSVDISFLDDDTLSLDVKDDFGLDYMITFDGKYVPIGGSKENVTSFTYNHSTKINYDGDYIFTVVDKAGNRTIASANIDSKRTPPKHSIDYDVHNYKYTKNLFAHIGLEYDDDNNDHSNLYEMILPAYMRGSSSSYFKPDSPITRAEIITLFCRITDLPYDSNAILKTKFTDIENHWAKDYISMGSNKKYVKGYKDKTFRPNNNITRAEFCELINNISSFKSKLSSLPAASNYNYADVNGHWAQSEIIKIACRDIVIGKNSYFYPDKPITRGEVVHAINKLYSLNPSANELKYIDSLYKKYYNFKDINNHKYYNDIVVSVVGMYREKIN